MIRFLRRLFSRRPPLQMHDPDFGTIRFWPEENCEGWWSRDDRWSVPFQAETLCCPGIPGDTSGPSPEARAFLLARREQHEAIWAMAEPAVRELMEGWHSFDGVAPRDAFFISALSKDDSTGDGWEVCFESRPPMKWVNFCLQAQGDAWVTNTIFT
jgi:hypothetical protein